MSGAWRSGQPSRGHDEPPRRILAVKLSSFGDVVHVTPCLRALRHAFPDADIRVAIERRWADALRALVTPPPCAQ